MAEQNRPTNTKLVERLLRRLDDGLPQSGIQPFAVKSVRLAPRRIGAVGGVGSPSQTEPNPALPTEPGGGTIELPDYPDLPDDLPEDVVPFILGWLCDELVITETEDGGYTIECKVYPRDENGEVITD